MDPRQFQIDYGDPKPGVYDPQGWTSLNTLPEVVVEMAKLWYGRLIADPIKSMGNVGAGIIGNVPQVTVTDATDLRRIGGQYHAQGGSGGVGDIVNALMLYSGPGIAAGKPGVTSVGVFGGEKALGANLAMRDIAEKAIKLGKDPDDVWKATGWKPGMEGKMKFEISDKDMVVNPEFWGPGGAKHSAWMDPKKNEWADVRMGQVVKHDAAYANYPEMRDVKVRLGQPEAMGGISGFYDEATNTATIKANLTREEATETFLHEVGGHFVQKKEGFARGGSAETANLSPEKYSKPLNDIMEKIKITEQSLGGEISKLSKKYYEGNGLKINELSKLEELRKTSPEISKLLEEKSVIYNEYKKKTPYEIYRNLAGEIEASDIVNRRTWDDDMRRAVPPDMRKDAIIRMGEGGERQMSVDVRKAYNESKVISGGSSVEIAVLRDKLGLSQQEMESLLTRASRDGDVVMALGEPSVSNAHIRSGDIDGNLLVRLDDSFFDRPDVKAISINVRQHFGSMASEEIAKELMK